MSLRDDKLRVWSAAADTPLHDAQVAFYAKCTGLPTTTPLHDLEAAYFATFDTIQNALDVACPLTAHETQAQAASWPEGFEDFAYRQKIDITGSADATLTDHILKLNVHRGIRRGDLSASDIFCADGCNADFSDLRFTDSTGEALDYQIAGKCAGEIIVDGSRIPHADNVIVSADFPDADLTQGDIVAVGTHGSDTGCYVSTDNGNNWTFRGKIVTGTGGHLCLLDSRGYLWASRTGDDLMRSIDGGATWVAVLALASGYDVPWYAMCEDLDGNIYAGKYHASLGQATIYKLASADVVEGVDANWTTSYTSATYVHVHCLRCDPYTGDLYAGIDGTGTNRALVRLPYGDTNWAAVRTGYGSESSGFVFTPDYVFFTGSETGGTAGRTIWRMTRSLASPAVLGTPAVVLATTGACQVFTKLGDTLYAIVQSYDQYPYPTGYASTDDGATWELIWEGAYDATSLHGYKYTTKNGTPTSDGLQLIMGKDVNSAVTNARLMANGGQALVFVKVPTITQSATTSIYLYYGNETAESASADMWNRDVLGADAALLARWEFTGNMEDSIGSNDGAKIPAAATGISYGTEEGSRHIGAGSVATAGQCLTFTAANGYVRVADSDDISCQASFSVLMWVKVPVASAYRMLICKGALSAVEYALEISNTNILCFVSAAEAIKSTGLYFPDNVWVQTGFTVAADGQTVKVILNGKAVSTLSLTAPLSAGAGNLGIGAVGRTDNTVHYPLTNGSIDDVRIYKDKVLTDAEIRQHYEARAITTNEPVFAFGDPSGQFSVVQLDGDTYTERLNVGPNILLVGNRDAVIDNDLNAADASTLHGFMLGDGRSLNGDTAVSGDTTIEAARAAL